MLGKRHEVAKWQSDFYRDQFRKILRSLAVLVVIMFILLAAIFYFILTARPQTYWGNTTDGKILPMRGAQSG